MLLIINVEKVQLYTKYAKKKKKEKRAAIKAIINKEKKQNTIVEIKKK